jgi:hypothetical protein
VASLVVHSSAPLVIEDAATDSRFDAANEPYMRQGAGGGGPAGPGGTLSIFLSSLFDRTFENCCFSV